MRDRDGIRLCWRHEVRLFWAAYGSLLDLTGAAYPRWSKRVIADARACPKCRFPDRRSIR